MKKMKFTRKTLPLPLADGRYLYVNKERLTEMKNDLDSFLKSNQYMVSKEFSIKALFSQGIKFNNAVEGYKDDLLVIDDVINKTHKNQEIPIDQRKRIINLYRGYRYILENNEFNKDSLRELYNILSNGLILESDLKEMGNYYRNKTVYIHYSPHVHVPPDKGVKVELIEPYMERLFEFLNNELYNDSMTDSYIKSQIIHFYFVYIHPYYDVNGRTSRTLSMWYLLEKEAYPYLIFNRGITLDKSLYCRIIRDVVKYSNLSYFLYYMLRTVKKELEKEYIINNIDRDFGELTNHERQSIYYVLSNPGENNIKDYTTFYNRFNNRKTSIQVFHEQILPLIDKEILNVVRYTKSYLTSHQRNLEYQLNGNYLNNNEKIKQLKL